MPKIPFWVFIVLALLYFSAVRIDTMDVDASQYAEMSREMLKSGDYLHLYDRGAEYLDKPPFLFWVSSLSMGAFGINNFGYKLPSILFALWAIFATYRLARLLYGENTGRMAALVLATCQGVFLMTNDIRCDTILMSWVITAVWLIQEWIVKRKLQYLLGGCAAIAFGMMTKGPIALMAPVFCFVPHWLLRREWKNIFQPAYLLSIVVIAVLLIPMSIGLYQQFDMHPEKMVNEQTGVSGLRFFYWSQSFGRITGESPWKNGVDMSFLLSNMLWSYLPWIFLLLPALVVNCITIVKQKFRLLPQQEWISTGGFIFIYLSLGSSKYQLPHYIFVAFPMASIIVAALIKDFIEEKKYKGLYKVMRPFMTTISCLLFVACLLIVTFVFPLGITGVILWLAALAVWLYVAFSKSVNGKLLWLPAVAILLVNIFFTNHFYYQLLKYEFGAQAGRYIHEQHIDTAQVLSYKVRDPQNALPFYAQGDIQRADTLASFNGQKYILTMDEGLKDLQKNGYKYELLTQGNSFKVSELTPAFLNPATRGGAVKRYYLVGLK